MRPKITICMGSSCFARGNERNLAVCEEFLSEHGLREDVDLDLVGSLCTGNCANGPVVVIDGKVYTRVDRALMRELLESVFKKG